MSLQEKFREQIANFQRHGTYEYKFDEAGNVVLNPDSNDFSKVFLALPLSDAVYNNSKVVSFYDPAFTEFIPTTGSVAPVDVDQLQKDLDAQKAENQSLNDQLNQVIAQQQSNPDGREEATKQVILELRKSLGQGRVDSDFSTDFPYAPVTKPVSNATTS